jgi:hypothetical protein
VVHLPRSGRLPGSALPLAELRHVALHLEAGLGGPQDLEWAWDGRTLWWLQARPITAAARALLYCERKPSVETFARLCEVEACFDNACFAPFIAM